MMFRNLKSEATSFLAKYKSESPAAYAAAQQAIGGLLILDGFIGIDNPFGGKKRAGIFGTLIGIIVGAVLFFAPNVVGNLLGTNQMTATTDATIVSVHQNTTNSNDSQQSSPACSAVARYTVNGKRYEQNSSISTSGMCNLTAGQSVKINYNPNNPAKWATDLEGLKKVMKYLPWLGIVILITSLFTFFIRLFSIIFGWKLLKSGRALAKTLPEGTNLSTAIKEIEHTFKSSLFGFSQQAPASHPAPLDTTDQPPTNTPQNL